MQTSPDKKKRQRKIWLMAGIGTVIIFFVWLFGLKPFIPENPKSEQTKLELQNVTGELSGQMNQFDSLLNDIGELKDELQKSSELESENQAPTEENEINPPAPETIPSLPISPDKPSEEETE